MITEEPEFTEVIENVTVPAGRNVKLACSVKNLGSFKVSKWIKNKTEDFSIWIRFKILHNFPTLS